MARESYPWIDRFRLMAAWMVVAIHTLPLASLGGAWDELLTLGLGRAAVPFFFMTTGFFLFREGFADWGSTARHCRRTALLYGAAMLLYLPVNLYAGQLRFPDLVGDVLIDGTMYHLWYFPALIAGSLLVCLLLRRVRLAWTLLISTVLYFFGLLGDSYWGLTQLLPPLRAAYDAIFTVSAYTRNGLFYAPLWLALGAWFSARRRHLPSVTVSVGGLAISAGALVAESAAVHRLGVRHDSMYVALIPLMFFLFALLLSVRGEARGGMARDVSLSVYLLHPAVILAVRLGAEILGLEDLLIERSMVHFLAVSVLSFGGSVVLWVLRRRFWPRRVPRRAEGTRIEIDCGALRRNLRLLSSEVPAGCEMMAVVKAEAYGHGAAACARLLWSEGVRRFAVATLEEGIALRRSGLGGEILVLGYTDPAEARRLRCYRLTQTLVSVAHAKALEAEGVRLSAHLKIDTGMHRIGVDAADADGIAAVFGLRHLRVTGVFTHLCDADGKSPESVAFTEAQVARFDRVCEMLTKSGIGQGVSLHVQNSAGLLNYPALQYDAVRIGIALYGLAAEEGARTAIHDALRPVLALRSVVAQVREISAGESVGYARAWTAAAACRLATVPIGYADGVPRDLVGGEVLVRGVRCPIVGRICMDQLTVDVTALPDVAMGDTVTLIGRDGDAEIRAEEVAARCATITNELLSRLGGRVKRVYRE